MSFSFQNSIGGFAIGDLGWTSNQGLLWPCLIREKKKLSSTSEVLPNDQFESTMRNRIIAFAQDRYEYKLQLLPTEKHAELLTRFDYQICPFNYTTAPKPVKDEDYNRALINAIQIQSSFAIPIEKPLVFPKTEPEVVIPPSVKDSIHIGCPMVSGQYLFAQIVQHMIDPALIQKISDGNTVVDLTSDLLQQGISHWKHSSNQVKFFSKTEFRSEVKHPPFPTLIESEYARIGSQVISKGDLLEMKNKKLFLVDMIKLKGDKLVLSGIWYDTHQSQEVSLAMFKQRFDPCFECDLMFDIVEQCHWNGDQIINQDRKVII